MSALMLAYFQPGRARGSAAEEAARLHEAAHAYRGSLAGSLMREAADPVQLLWLLVEDLARRIGIDLAAQLHQVALARGIDLDALRRAPAPAPALLELLHRLSHSDPQYLLVPGPHHFDGFGVPGKAIERLISRVAPGTRVVWGTPRAGTGSGAAGLVAEVELAAVANAIDDITLRLRRAMALRGLSDLTTPLLRLLDVLIEDAVHAAHTDSHAAATIVRVRVCCPPGAVELCAQVRETPRHAGPLPAQLDRICAAVGGRATREAQPGLGTLTTLWLPLTDASDTPRAPVFTTMDSAGI